MLVNHKIKLNLDNFIEHIKYEDGRSFISKDGRAFSCVVSGYYNIQVGQPIQVQIGYHEPFPLVPKIENFMEQGFIEMKTPIKVVEQIELLDSIIGYAYDSDGMLLSFKCTTDDKKAKDDVKLVYQDKNTSAWYYDRTEKYYIEDGFITYNGVRYNVSFDEDGVEPFQTIKGKTYLVKNGKRNQWEKKQRLTFIAPYDNILPIDKLQCGKVESYIEMDGVEYVLSEEYANEILYNGKLYTLYENINGKYSIVEVTYGENGTENYEEIKITTDDYKVINSVVSRYLVLNGTKYYEDALSDITPYPDITSGSITINGRGFEIKERYVPSDKGDVLLINIDNDKFYGELTTRYITVESVSAYEELYYSEPLVVDEETSGAEANTDEVVDIDGIKYLIGEVEMINFNGEREIKLESKLKQVVDTEKTSAEGIEDELQSAIDEKEINIFSVTLDDLSKVYFKQNEDVLEPIFKSHIEDNTSYPILNREKIVVDEIPYYRDPNSRINANLDDSTKAPFIVRRRPLYNLRISQFIEPNLCVCCVDLGRIVPSKYANPVFSSIHKSIYFNQDKYVLKAQQIRFATNKNDIHAFDALIGDDIIGKIEPFPSISLFLEKNNIVLPLQMGNLHGTNLNQDDLVMNGFFQKHIDEAINPIVDIEKDIYYPMKENENKILTDVDNIEFYLHLRTRNQDWTIREDYLTRFNDVYEDIPKVIVNGDEVVENTVDRYDEISIDLKDAMESVKENENFKNTSWNVFDYYEIENDAKVENSNCMFSEDNCYYQPSDLLGFFDFNDMDIFYQKSKVGKTFLRMMLFDSPDPQRQSLLATSTIFFDSGTLFGKFSDNMSNPTEGIRFISPISWKSSSDYISVSKEPINEKYDLTLDEENRLSSTVTLTDKLASTKSAEGFYQYIFKGLSSMLHERTLYLRIQLNHAGHGEVIDLIQPMEYEKDEHGNPIKTPAHLQLIDLGDKDNRNEWKKGLEPKELYNKLYIPINVKYDLNSNKYCWYLPYNLSKENDSENSIKFNLYEIKIRN